MASESQTTKAGGYPASIHNPDDWAAFLAHYLDNRATNAVHNGIGLVALHIVDAITDAQTAGFRDGYVKAENDILGGVSAT